MLTCHICKGDINPAVERWDAEHTIRRVLSNDDSPINVMPAHEACHDIKTPLDIKANSKGKRVRDKHYGIIRKQGFRKPPPGFAYSWKARRMVKVGDEVE